jgi:hypothetical protein
MGIKRYKANADNTIVNAYQPNLRTRGTGANCGESDVLECFSIYDRTLLSGSKGDGTVASSELSRIIINFPIADIKTDRTNGKIPASGSVSFYLRLFNAQTSKTVPRNFKLVVYPMSQSWEEGNGVDLETYKDQTKGGIGSNWIYAASGSKWQSRDGDDIVGGAYKTGSSDPAFTQSFTTGLEDLKVDISDLVEKWVSEDIDRYGVGIHLSSSYEAYFSSSLGENVSSGSVLDNLDGAKTSYYTKRFFARGSQYFFKRPTIEARWNSVTRDDRGDFYYSSSLAPADDNLNVLYLYNYVRGRLVNIPSIGTDDIYVTLYSGSSAPTGSKLVLYDGYTNVTGGHVSTGIYSASIAITAATTPLADIFDVWHDDGGTQFFTSSVKPKTLRGHVNTREPTYYMNITNMRDRYRSDETARFNLYVREKNWKPTIYTVASERVETIPVNSASYRVYRTYDGLEAIPYGTGSDFCTGLSYDISGNYFDFDMNLLDPGYAYALRFAFYDPELKSWTEQNETFKFRVESYEY